MSADDWYLRYLEKAADAIRPATEEQRQAIKAVIGASVAVVNAHQVLEQLVAIGGKVEERDHMVYVEIDPELADDVCRALAGVLPSIVGLTVNGQQVSLFEWAEKK